MSHSSRRIEADIVSLNNVAVAAVDENPPTKPADNEAANRAVAGADSEARGIGIYLCRTQFNHGRSCKARLSGGIDHDRICDFRQWDQEIDGVNSRTGNIEDNP